MSEPLIMTRAQIEHQEEVPIRHPLNERSEMYYRPLTENAGFEHGGFHLVRVPPGRESNELHSHRFEEEFYYVLRGRARLLVGDREHELGAGDFAAFPKGAEAHLMTNPYEEDLVYFAGGSRSPFEWAEFPRHGKVLMRVGQEAWMVDGRHLEKPTWGADD